MCTNCGTTSTSVWSKDDTGYLLCHACFFYNQALKKTKTKRIGQHCSNCRTTTTSSWRRNNSGEIVCNACGLYLKLHGINRPLALMKDNISTRRRKPKDNGDDDVLVLDETRVCVKCGTRSTPLWLQDEIGYILCNDCYLFTQVSKRTVSETKRKELCTNCKTTTTSFWRRNSLGEVVCNACGLYFKLHGVNRPLTMKKNIIFSRRRKPKDNGSKSINSKGPYYYY